MEQPFLNLRQPAPPDQADALMLALPYDGTTSYGKGTARGPAAIWKASGQVEDWDEETDFDLATLRIYDAKAVVPQTGESPGDYLARVKQAAVSLHAYRGLVLGVGGEHSVTPPLVQAACEARRSENVTVVQFDAHSDLRDEYDGTPFSHACAMRRVVDLGARVIAIGIRSADREEMAFGKACGRVETFAAHELARNRDSDARLRERLGTLEGPVYVTIDVDGLEVSLCPGTGTPQPGGLGWWQTLGYLKTLLLENRRAILIGADVVETVPIPATNVNEFVAARLLLKMLVYWIARR